MPRREGLRSGGLRAWTPRWWRGEGGPLGAAADIATRPAEQIYSFAARLRNRLYDRGLLPVRSASVPVISVGNIVVGGAGKTPFTAWLARVLLEWGRKPAIVLRGYGLDEVLLHRELNPETPVIASPRRSDGARRAEESGCDVVLLDDGFQHRALDRDLDLVLVPAESWSERRHLLPRGPWREDPTALRRADVVVVTRKSAPASSAREVAADLERSGLGRTAICHFAADSLHPLHDASGPPIPIASLEGREVLAVASLADPRPFRDHLEASGATVELAIFPDHHYFSRWEAAQLHVAAAGRPIVMTRKDAVKLRPLMDDAEAFLLDQRVEIEYGAEMLMNTVRAALEG